MSAMKKRILTLLLLAAAALPALAVEPLADVLRRKDWTELAALCGDDSHQAVAEYFRSCQAVAFAPLRPSELLFFARFPEAAEIGEISYEQAEGRYRRLELKRTIKPLYFIRSFARYPVDGLTLRLGDAEVNFKKGVLYRGLPIGSIFLFSGEWEFRIRPESEEERLTLQSLERSDTLVREARAGVFVLAQPDELLQRLPPAEEGAAPGDEETLALYRTFQERWGMPVTLLDELWYFPFAQEFNAVLFAQRGGRSHFRYIFNSGLAPDTSLVLLPENKFYLNYNAVKGLKFSQTGVDELDSLQLNLFLNPQEGFLSATSVLNFKEPSSIKTVSLNPGLAVKGFGRSAQHELQLFRREDTYYLLGEDLRKFSFFYAGAVPSAHEGGDLAKIVFGRSGKNVDRYYLLDRDQDFYPNPGQHFFSSRLRISLPASMECLASGSLVAKRRQGERSEFEFASPGSKGVSLVCGDFRKLASVPGRLPLQVYGHAKLDLRDAYAPAALRGYLDFLLDAFGPLEVPEVNLLLRRWQDYGGWSHQGFVVFNLLDDSITVDDLGTVRRLRMESPVVFGDINRDNLIHELAHQWWGGLVSWKSYQDQWLTEGLAQFATLLYLEEAQGEASYRRALAGCKRWLGRKNDAGPIIYGRRIANLSGDLQAFQSIVYNKAALVFLMLKDILGEEELLQRLRQVLADCRHQSLASPRFIQLLCRGEERLLKFFNGWVYSRQLPRVRRQSVVSGATAVITLTQENGDFVFPLAVRVATREGKYTRTLVVEQREQVFKIFENSPIQSLQVEAPVAPVELHD